MGGRPVAALALDRASGSEVRAHARLHGYIIVTKDADFSHVSTRAGFPPFVVWTGRGTCATAEVEASLQRHSGAVQALVRGEGGVLTLY